MLLGIIPARPQPQTRTQNEIIYPPIGYLGLPQTNVTTSIPSDKAFRSLSRTPTALNHPFNTSSPQPPAISTSAASRTLSTTSPTPNLLSAAVAVVTKLPPRQKFASVLVFPEEAVTFKIVIKTMMNGPPDSWRANKRGSKHESSGLKMMRGHRQQVTRALKDYETA
ncbi:hypothetical protein EC991_008272 [Linnemannia zychae]|nr:hypothetical protein EC991_008272 [Linnemannia zychae]